MVGREVKLNVQKKPAHPEDVILKVDHLCATNPHGSQVVDDVSFDVRAGEIWVLPVCRATGKPNWSGSLQD
jgi:simple sugar transport system ATP-binding protein